jgi:hypothetical protein
MTYSPDQWMTLKKVYLRDHAEAHFEDPIKKEFFNIVPKNELSRYSGSSVRKGSFFIHYGPGGVFGRFDF